MDTSLPEHLCIVACNTFDDDEIVAFFEKLGIDRTALRKRANAKLEADGELTGSTSSSMSGDNNSNNNNNNKTGLQAKRPYQSNTQQGKLVQDDPAQHAGAGAKESALAKFAFDLTEKARSGKVDPVIGREEEVTRCIQILARKSKNNPILLGEPGVGKTAIAEGMRTHRRLRRSVTFTRKTSVFIRYWFNHGWCERAWRVRIKSERDFARGRGRQRYHLSRR